MAIITEAQIIKALQKYNPWWRNPEAIRAEAKPHKRTVYHEALRALLHPAIRRFAVLSGARRVGKTTVLYQMMDRLIADGVPARNILYASFDNPIVRAAGVEDVLDAYEALYPVKGERYLFFDEIQYARDWELWMKVVYDSRRDVRLAATGSASPIIEKGASDGGTGRWNVLKVPTMSLYEYCELLELPDRPEIPDGLRISALREMRGGELADLMNRFAPLQRHFNRYLAIGGFPELALSDDDAYAQRMLRDDVVDKVIKRDVLALFNVRNPLSMEKLFLYLCMTSSEIFSKQTAAKELESISVSTIEDYIGFLEKSNLIYISAPVGVGKKAALKGRPKIYIADAAIRNAVLMADDVLSDDREMGVMVETAVYKHVLSFYRGAPAAEIGYYRKAKENQKEVDVVVSLPQGKILCEVKYRNNPPVSETDAIVALSGEEGANVKSSFLITKSLADCGAVRHGARAQHGATVRHSAPIPVFRVPALPFVYLLGRAEAKGEGAKL